MSRSEIFEGSIVAIDYERGVVTVQPENQTIPMTIRFVDTMPCEVEGLGFGRKVMFCFDKENQDGIVIGKLAN